MPTSSTVRKNNINPNYFRKLGWWGAAAEAWARLTPPCESKPQPLRQRRARRPRSLHKLELRSREGEREAEAANQRPGRASSAPPPPAHAPTLGVGKCREARRGAGIWGVPVASPEWRSAVPLDGRSRSPRGRVQAARAEDPGAQLAPRRLSASRGSLLRACAAATRGRRLAYVSV